MPESNKKLFSDQKTATEVSFCEMYLNINKAEFQKRKDRIAKDYRKAAKPKMLRGKNIKEY